MTITGIIEMFINLGLKLIPFLGALAFLTFVFGVGNFIKNSDNEKEIGKSKNIIIWGIVGLFVLFSIWGILAFLKSEFGFNGDVFIPQIYI